MLKKFCQAPVKKHTQKAEKPNSCSFSFLDHRSSLTKERAVWGSLCKSHLVRPPDPWRPQLGGCLGSGHWASHQKLEQHRVPCRHLHTSHQDQKSWVLWFDQGVVIHDSRPVPAGLRTYESLSHPQVFVLIFFIFTSVILMNKEKTTVPTQDVVTGNL